MENFNFCAVKGQRVMIISVKTPGCTFFVAKYFTLAFNGKEILTYLLSTLRFYTHWTHLKIVSFSDIFRGYWNLKQRNGLMIKVCMLSVGSWFLRKKFKFELCCETATNVHSRKSLSPLDSLQYYFLSIHPCFSSYLCLSFHYSYQSRPE